MDFKTITLPDDIAETLGAIHRNVIKYNPEIGKDTFIRQVIMEWLEPYERKEERTITTRDKVVLKNNLKKAIKLSRKSITQVANEIGVNRVYLSQVISGRYEPSVTVLLLIIDSLRIPVDKIKDLFYLKPAQPEV